MNSLFSALLVVHVIAGTTAVVGGLPALLTPKGNAAHRRSGRVFVVATLVVIGSAIGMNVLNPSPYFIGLTASAALAAFSGYRVLGRKRPDLHPSDRAGGADWLVASVALVVSGLLIGLVVTGRITTNVPVVSALGYGTAMYALYDLWRFAMPTAFIFTPRLWFYEHLVKMISAYFAAVAAFSGSVLLLLPEPWRQLWATMLGQTLAIAGILYYRRRFRRGYAPPDPSVTEHAPGGHADADDAAERAARRGRVARAPTRSRTNPPPSGASRANDTADARSAEPQ